MKWGLKGGISIYANSGPPRYVLWCCGSICHEVLTFIQVGCGHTVLKHITLKYNIGQEFWKEHSHFRLWCFQTWSGHMQQLLLSWGNQISYLFLKQIFILNKDYRYTKAKSLLILCDRNSTSNPKYTFGMWI